MLKEANLFFPGYFYHLAFLTCKHRMDTAPPLLWGERDVVNYQQAKITEQKCRGRKWDS